MRDKKSIKLLSNPVSNRLPPLHALHVFQVAARHQSFARAADELCVTHGAVSRQIRQLEESLDCAVFDRRNRAVFLTATGQSLFASCTQAFETLGETIEKIRQRTCAPQPLVLSCEPTLAMRWLIPRLGRFRQSHPDLPLHLLAAGGPVAFARDRVDVALRRNDFAGIHHSHAEPLGPELMGPVCTPECAKTASAASSTVEPHTALSPIPTFRLLHTRTRPEAWTHWLQRHPGLLVRREDDHFDHFYLSLQAASASLGLALGSIYMVEDDVQLGRLVAPWGFEPDGSQYVLMSPTPFINDPRRALLLEWLRQEMTVTRKAFV